MKSVRGPGDGGTKWFAVWGMAIMGVAMPVLAVAPNFQGTSFISFGNSTAVAIPTGPAVVSSTITVIGAQPAIWDVDVQTFITHTFNADLDITLRSPQGTIVSLTTDNGVGNDNVFNGTVWDDSANPGGQVPYEPYEINNGLTTDHAYANNVVATPLVPEEALGAFIGEDPNGTWTLTITDLVAVNTGTLHSWSLEIVAKSPFMKVKKPQKQQEVQRGRKTKAVWTSGGQRGA